MDSDVGGEASASVDSSGADAVGTRGVLQRRLEEIVR